MPLRIGFDLDGVFADMDAELVRQSEVVFGAPMVRRSQPAATDPASAAESDAAGAASPDDEPADDTPAVAQLQMTGRQQRRLWRHVATIENFWETLQELEPGVIPRLASLAIDRR